MKKIMVLLLLMLSTFTLSACDLLGGDLNEIIDNVTSIAETFTMEDQTIEIGTESFDWPAYVAEINDNLPDDINIEVVEDNIQYGTPGTYTVTLRLTAPDDIDFTHTFNVTVVEGGWTPGEIIDGFDGDITYLQTFMDPIMNSDAKETTTSLEFNVNQMDYETGEMVPYIVLVESVSTVVQGAEMDMMSQELIINMDGEIMPFSFYLVREDTALTFYLETTVLDELDEEQRAIAESVGIDMTYDYMMFTIEGDFSTTEEFDILSVFDELTQYLYGYMGDVDPDELAYVETQMNYLIANIDIFAKYLTLEYYMNQEGMSAELSVNDDEQVVMSMTMATTMYGDVIGEFLTDLQNFASGLDDVEVPNMSELPEYQNLLTILNGLQPMQIDALYDPASPTEMSFALDLTGFVNTLAALASGGEMMGAAVNALTIDVVVRSGAEITLPENASDMNSVLRNVVKIMLVDEVASNVNDYIEYIEWYEETALPVDEEVTISQLMIMMDSNVYYYDDMFGTLFNTELSYLVNRGTLETPDYYFNIVWADGMDVFVGELRIEDVNTLLEDVDMVIPIIELVNDEALDFARVLSLLE